MSGDLLQSLARRAGWVKQPKVENPDPVCALHSCSRSLSRWQRLRSRYRPIGTFLQGAFYCHPQCLETALRSHLSQLRILAAPTPPSNRIPLGLLMVARGKLSYLEVSAALEAQRRARRGKIGEWIEKLGFATEQEVTSALALQWGCPVATSFDPATIYSPAGIPLSILEAFQMLPLNYAASTNTLYLAFGERVDYAALYAIEKILDCRTQPCVAGRKSIARQIEAMRQLSRPSDVEFGPMNNLADMARIASSYTLRLSPGHLRMCRVGSLIWVRFDDGCENVLHERSNECTTSGSIVTNLVFRLANESRRPTDFLTTRRDMRLSSSWNAT